MMPRVALVNMPFSTTTRPSIQVGLLQSILAAHDIPAASHYLNLPFASTVGWNWYEKISVRGYWLGEWIFSRAAFGDAVRDTSAYLEAFAASLREVYEDLGQGPDFLRRLRETEAPAFIDRCLDAVAWDDYDVIGFTSTFNQNCAAFALARRLKARRPALTIVFGGANFEDEMGLEYMRALPWIDYAVVGEGDYVFPALLKQLAAGQTGAGLPGVITRGPKGTIFPGRSPLVENLDALPDPDYEEFFRAGARLQVPSVIKDETWVPFETARGCWWGAKHHCTFCGLNGAGMAYRSKSPARVLATLETMRGRYPSRHLEAVDNILDQRYINEVFRPLAEAPKDYDIFYEMKVNLTQPQIQTLAKAGVRHVQPGIESMSTRVLRLMRKGATAIQNVRFLKWAEAYDMEVTWHLIFGFPGERLEDYEQQLSVLRLIPHLQPPRAAGRIWLERYSPNFTRSDELGIYNLRPEPAYAYIYPDEIDRRRVAYFFDYDAPDTVPSDKHRPLFDYLDVWRAARKAKRAPYLAYDTDGSRTTVIDARRTASSPRVLTFEGARAIVYEYCSATYHTASQILIHLRDELHLDVGQDDVESALAAFLGDGLMLEESGNYLSLAVPVKPAVKKLFTAIARLPPAVRPEHVISI